MSKKSLGLLIKKYTIHHTVTDLSRPLQPKKLSLEHLKALDEALANNDEVSTTELLCSMLKEVFRLKVSPSTVQRAKKDLGSYTHMHVPCMHYTILEHICE